MPRLPQFSAAPNPLLRLLSTQPPPVADSGAAAAAGGAAEGGGVSPTIGRKAIRDATRDDAFLLFESPTYERFVNMMMLAGRKQQVRKIMWSTMKRIRDAGHDPQEVFFTALDNVRPMMEMKTTNRATGPTPYPINFKRAEGQAMKWIIQAARKRGLRNGIKFDVKLTEEFLAAYTLKGGAVNKREQVHRDAVTNQAAAHFRWRVGSGSAPAGSIDMDRKSYRPVGRRSVKRLQGAMP